MSFLNLATLNRKLMALAGIPLIGIVAVTCVAMSSLFWLAQELSDMGTGDMSILAPAGEIDGNLMDEAIEYEKALRASYAMRANEPQARAQFEASVQEFDKLAAVAAGAKNAALAEVLKAKDDDDAQVVQTYAGLERRLGAIGAAQKAFETRVQVIFKAIAQDRHADAFALVGEVESLQGVVEKEIAALVSDMGKITANNVAQAQAGGARAKLELAVLAALTLLVSLAGGFAVARSLTRELGADPREATAVATRVRQNSESVATASAQIAQGNLD